MGTREIRNDVIKQWEHQNRNENKAHHIKRTIRKLKEEGMRRGYES
jgi:hypothetical protein